MSPDELAAHVRARVDDAPPLTSVQRQRLAALLAPAVAAVTRARKATPRQ